MTPKKLLLLAAILGVAGAICLTFGIITGQTYNSYIKHHYQSLGHNEFLCSGSPSTVADNIADAQTPQAQADDQGTYYLRYSDAIVIVGPSSGHPCTVRLESLNSGYSHGHYIFLGPGFSPGSPSHSSGGSSGGPGGVK